MVCVCVCGAKVVGGGGGRSVGDRWWWPYRCMHMSDSFFMTVPPRWPGG